MTPRTLRIIAACSLIALSACAPVISSQWRSEARKNLTVDEVLHDPAAYTGALVIWGGIVIGDANRPEGTALAVLDTPLDHRERPEESERSRGRFIAMTSRFLDPAVYTRGRKVTVAGEIAGTETRPLGKSKATYTYPVLRIRQIYLWSIEPRYVPVPDAWWWYGDEDFWPNDEGFGRWLGNQNRENLGQEQIERDKVERGEQR